jgi:hypothetical protein
MAKQLLDGMEVIVPDDEFAGGVDIEDAVRGTAFESGSLNCFDQEEYQAAMSEFTSAELLKLLPTCDGYHEALRLAEIAAHDSLARLGMCKSTDPKLTEIKSDQEKKSYVLQWLRNIVEDAELVPRPILATE